MCRRLLSLLCLAVLSLAFAPAPFPRAGREVNDLKAIQGYWADTRHVSGGQVEASHGILIRGNRIDVGRAELPFRLHVRRKPCAIDIGDPDAVGVLSFFVGIYKLEGDKLTLCYRDSKDEGGRPRAFDGSSPGTHLHVFKRKRP
jgi:uncharacterized protein (TIGR03067 family)